MEQVQVQVQVQVQPPPLKCPRCDSSNTKFCYYNNYSLSQPRHFCKSCKRYWTRGGTLRNVPVGGGCRKNKTKVIKSSSFAPMSTSLLAKPSTTVQSSRVDVVSCVSSSTRITHINNPLLYNSLPTSISTHLNPPYDLSLPQFNRGSGLGFSTDFVTSQNFGLGTSFSGLQQENLVSNGFKGITPQTVRPYGFLGLEDVQILVRNGTEGSFQLAKDEKMEGHGNKLDWNYTIEDHEINSLDPPFMWNSSTGGVWIDSSNIGSSVPSLI